MNIGQMWRVYRVYNEVKNMDKQALIKILITAALAAASVAGSQYIAGGEVSGTAAGTAALGAVIAYLKQSPLPK